MRLVQEGYRCLFYVGGRIPCGGRIPQSTSFHDGGDEFDDGWLLRENMKVGKGKDLAIESKYIMHYSSYALHSLY